MRVTIIADNYVDSAGMIAEHGFACLIETGSERILFDTGQGSALINNLKTMGIDGKFDKIIISHGHYDHTGGISKSFDELSEYCSDIYASHNIFDEHLAQRPDGSYNFIGFEKGESDVASKYNLHFNDKLTEISENIYLSGVIKRYEAFDADKRLYVRIDGECCKDMFRDEQYLVIKTTDGIHLFTGCTHCGAINLLQHARELFPDDKLLSVTGGLHLFKSERSDVDRVITFLENESVEKIFTGHCTGLDAAIQMQNKFGDRVKITKAGMVYEL